MRAAPVLLALLLAAAAAGCEDDAPAVIAATEPAPTPPPFPCVHFEDLRRLLPRALDGLEVVKDEGSTGKYDQVSISEAERVFSDGDGKEISVRIVDTTLVDQLGQAIRAAAEDASGRAKDDPTAPILADEGVGFVRYDRGKMKAEANLLVADRFVVAVTTRGFEGTDRARKVANAIDIAGLALLR